VKAWLVVLGRGFPVPCAIGVGLRAEVQRRKGRGGYEGFHHGATESTEKRSGKQTTERIFSHGLTQRGDAATDVAEGIRREGGREASSGRRS
jgi:hypothetical protein